MTLSESWIRSSNGSVFGPLDVNRISEGRGVAARSAGRPLTERLSSRVEKHTCQMVLRELDPNLS